MGKNKGFSLVELLISIAILSIVLATVTSVMVTGTKQFSKGSADAGMQNEAQLAVNQIEDMIIDTNGGVMYDPTTKELLLLGVTDSGRTKELIRYDSASETLLYTKWNMILDPSTNTYVEEIPAVFENQVLAEGVSDFVIDLADLIKEYDKNGVEVEVVKSVLVKIGYISDGGLVSYETSPLVTLRNRMMLSGDANYVYNNTPDIDYNLELAISSSADSPKTLIVNMATEVERGNSYNVWALVNGTEYNINNLINWSIDVTASSITSTGVLTVDDNEPSQYIKITATHQTDPGKSVVATVKVVGNEKSLDSVSIELMNNGTDYNPYFRANPSATNYTTAELSELEYTWSVEPASWASIDSNGGSTTSLTIVKSDETYNKTLNVRVRVYSPSHNQWVEGVATYTIPEEKIIKSLDSVAIQLTSNGEDGTDFNPHFKAIPSATNYTTAELAELQYTWSVDPSSWASVDSNGTSTTSLSIDKSDATYNQILNIRVRAYSPSNDQCVEGVATYTIPEVKIIKSLDSVTIQLTSSGGSGSGFNPHFKAYPSATNYTDAELDELVYTWSIDQPTWAAIDSNGSSTTSLTIVTSDETYNQILNIRVRAYSPSNDQWVEGETSYMIPPAGSTGDSYLERGRENSQVRYSFSTNYGVISYSVAFCDAVGNELPELDHLLQYIVLQNVSWGGFGFDIKPGLPADRDYYVKVKIHNGASWTTDTYDYERILYIAGVQLFGRTTSTPWTGLGRYDCLDYSMAGYYDVAWVKFGEEPYELSVESIQYEAPEGVEVQADLTASWMMGGTGNLVRSGVIFSAPGYEGDESLIKVKSIKVKVSMKEYPNVFTYSNIIFTE